MAEPFRAADSLLICHRCGAEVHPGRGDYYLVQIEAFADPAPSEITDEDLARDHGAEMARLAESLNQLSDQEAMDQVYRRLTLHLCTACYARWIDDPAGG